MAKSKFFKTTTPAPCITCGRLNWTASTSTMICLKLTSVSWLSPILPVSPRNGQHDCQCAGLLSWLPTIHRRKTETMWSAEPSERIGAFVRMDYRKTPDYRLGLWGDRGEKGKLSFLRYPCAGIKDAPANSVGMLIGFIQKRRVPCRWQGDTAKGSVSHGETLPKIILTPMNRKPYSLHLQIALRFRCWLSSFHPAWIEWNRASILQRLWPPASLFSYRCRREPHSASMNHTRPWVAVVGSA